MSASSPERAEKRRRVLRVLAQRVRTPTMSVEVDVPELPHLPAAVEVAGYRAVAEALTNAAKHSRASDVRVVVRLRDEGVLWARVEDNGVGGARILPGGGLDGIVNRVVAAGGQARIDSPAGGPTSVEVSIPCAS